jgi:putative Mg2+ transporter-C (MgtC) family protein
VLELESLLSNFIETAPGFIGSIVVSIACGLVIGLERESRGKPAGARTLVLICLGSAIFVQISMILAGPHGDPARVAAQIVTGIGFLGAGAILHQSERGYIAGLTTAATVWVSSAIGMLVGSGKYVFAVIAVFCVVLTLRALRLLEKRLFVDRNIEGRRISFDPRHGKTEWKILGLLEDHLVNPGDYRFFGSQGSDRPYLDLQYCTTNRNHRSFLSDVAEMDEVFEIERTEPSFKSSKAKTS